MSEQHDDKYFFKLRKEGKIYISKVFKFSSEKEDLRNIHIVFENSNLVLVGEVNGALSLRQTPKGKQQVLAVVSQDDKKIKRLTFQRFDEKKNGDFSTSSTDAFTFRGDEFQHLIAFLQSMEFIDLSNKEKHQIEDLSSNTGNKTIIDQSEVSLLKILNGLAGVEREKFLTKIKDNLTNKDIQILLGRKEALEQFKTHLSDNDWNEPDWQSFFQKENWIFGYGLDYRIMKPFDREMVVSASGTDNREKAIVDFLMTFNDFTATVEIKRPDTRIFDKKNRSGACSFSRDFIDAYSQVLEQKTEWHILGQQNNLFNKQGNEKLLKRTRDAKAVLVIGNKSEFLDDENIREREIKQDTFELFRQSIKNIDIITYDELLERATFIVNS